MPSSALIDALRRQIGAAAPPAEGPDWLPLAGPGPEAPAIRRGRLHVLAGGPGDREAALVPGLLATRLLARLAADGMVMWAATRLDLYPVALAQLGVPLDRLLLVEPPDETALLWTMEEALATAGLAGIIGEIGPLGTVAARRLQLACERRGGTALILRRWRNLNVAERADDTPTSAWSEWRVSALPPVPDASQPMRAQLDLLRTRDGCAASWIIESDHACDFRVAALLDDRADRPAAARRRA